MDSRVKPQGCTNFKLRQLGRVVSRHYDAHLAAEGLKTTQYSLLSHIVALGPLRPSDLARRMGLDASSVTRNRRRLLDAGWVRQGPGGDARSRAIEATPAGRAKRARCQHAWKKAQLALNARVGAARVVSLHALIDDCLREFGADAA